MESYEIGRLVYLVLLGTAVAGYFIAENRKSLGKTAQQAVVWGLIFLGVIGAYGLWSDIRDEVAPRQSVVAGTGQIAVPRQFDGHFYLTLQLNGKPVDFMIDTGASEVVLSQGDARKAGIKLNDLAYTGRAMTANGMVRTAPATVDEIRLGAIHDRGFTVWVNDGDMDGSLLGMSYLRRFDSIEIRGDKLILTR